MKDYNISSIRMTSTIMVVMLHIYQTLMKYSGGGYLNIAREWLNLGLVMFFTMSAFLYAGRTVEGSIARWLVHRYKEVALPGIITTVSAFLVYAVVLGGINGQKFWG